MMIDSLLFLLLLSFFLVCFLTQHPDEASPRLAARADGTIQPINRFNNRYPAAYLQLRRSDLSQCPLHIRH